MLKLTRIPTSSNATKESLELLIDKHSIISIEVISNYSYFGDCTRIRLKDGTSYYVSESPESISRQLNEVGQWINAAGMGDYCSLCHVHIPDLYPLNDKAAFCPNCGHPMKDEEGNINITITDSYVKY